MQAQLQALCSHRGTAPPAHWSAPGIHLLSAGQTAGDALSTAPDAGLTLVADGHVDNTADIRMALDLSPNATLAEMLLAAYRHWGRNCARYLLGEFAFAIVSASSRSVFLCRDPIGVKPLYLYRDVGQIVFASEAGIVADCLAEFGGRPKRLDERSLAMLLTRGYPEQGTTCFAGIDAVLPATTLLIEGERVRYETYWRPDPGLVLRHKTDADYDTAFRETFEESLNDRMRRAGTKAATLSGGLDSSTIALLAARSAPSFRVYSTSWPASPDGPFIDAVLNTGSFTPSAFDAISASPLGATEVASDKPVSNVNWYSVTNMFAAAASDGISTILSGFGADEVVGYGFERLILLARSGDWVAFARESAALSQTFGVAQRDYFRMFGEPAILATARTGHWLKFARHLHGARRHLRVSPRALMSAAGLPATRAGLRRLVVRAAPPSEVSSLVPPYLAADFVRRTDLQDRLRAEEAGYLPDDLRRSQIEAFCTAPQISQMLESYDLTAAQFGLEQTYPFLDRRMVELCFALPYETKLVDGWTRLILRRSMQDVLPERVCWRTDKGNDSMGARLALQASKDTLDALIVADPDPIAPYFDVDAVRTAYARYLAAPEEVTATDLFAVFQAASTAIWLDRAGLDCGRSAP